MGNLLKSLMPTLAIGLFAGLFMFVSTERYESATSRAESAESQLYQVTTQLEVAQKDYQSALIRLESERALASRLSVKQNDLYETIEQKDDALKASLTKLSSNDESVNDWADQHVPDSVVQLLKQSASNDCQNQNRDPENSASGAVNSKLPNPYDCRKPHEF